MDARIKTWRAAPWRMVMVLATGVLIAIGCDGSGGSATGFEEADGPTSVRVLPIKQIKYMHPTTTSSVDGSGSLELAGDLDGDGVQDVFVAGSGGKVPRGWIAAWSLGKDEPIWETWGDWPETRTSEKDKGYRLNFISLVGDLDGDGVTDLAANGQKPRTSGLLLISGKTGKLIKRLDLGKESAFAAAIRAEDVTGDNKPELWFARQLSKRVGVVQVNPATGEMVRDVAQLWPGVEGNRRLVVARYDDDNGDGVDELVLVRRLPGSEPSQEVAIVDGKALRVLRTFTTPANRVLAENTWMSPGNLTGDSTADLVWATTTGEGSSGRTSSLRLIDGSTGKIAWLTTGDMGMGDASALMDARTGKMTPLPADVGFGGRVVTVPDVTGDGRPDLATIASTGNRTGTAFVLASSDGSLVGTLAPDASTTGIYPEADHLLLVENAGSEAGPALVTAADRPEGGTGLVVLDLPVGR